MCLVASMKPLESLCLRECHLADHGLTATESIASTHSQYTCITHQHILKKLVSLINSFGQTR
jgi:hypothetical protein